VDRKAAYVTVARVLRPHGRRGEVAAEILTDFPQRLKSLRSVKLFDPDLHTAANGVSVCTVKSCWLSQSRGGQAIFHFDGADSVDEAKRLVGLEVQIPIGDRVRLPQGSYYVTDLAGCEVIEQDGRSLGRVREVEFVGDGVRGTPNLAVNSPLGELLIPLAQDICVKIDIPARRITVVLPDGLRDLNARS
jgi:16S rRNA processing protein RimM